MFSGLTSKPSSEPAPTTSTSTSSSPRDTVLSFVKEAPAAMYTFDSDDDKKQSELCRRTKEGTSCIKVETTSKKLFETMQNMGFFCALPIDPTRTHMECRPIPK